MVTGGDTSAELDPPDRPHLLGFSELNRLEAELSLDLLPGVVGPDLEEDVFTLLLLELGVDVEVGLSGVPEAPEKNWIRSHWILQPFTWRYLLS